MSAKNQRLLLDLEKNKDLAQLVADLEPGEKLDAVISIVAKDDKTLTVDLEEVSNHIAEDGEDEEDDVDDAPESDDEPPAFKVARGA